MSQTLTTEEMAYLEEENKKRNFAPDITQYEKLRAICMHQDENGNHALILTNGGFKCTICGKSFQLAGRCKEKDIKNAVDTLIDIVETIKIMYPDMPTDKARDFFQITAMLEKIPDLYKYSRTECVPLLDI